MLYKNKKEISAVYYGSKVITAIYKGTKLVWQAIRSCFGKGFWDNNKPWDNSDSWKN